MCQYSHQVLTAFLPEYNKQNTTVWGFTLVSSAHDLEVIGASVAHRGFVVMQKRNYRGNWLMLTNYFCPCPSPTNPQQAAGKAAVRSALIFTQLGADLIAFCYGSPFDM